MIVCLAQFADPRIVSHCHLLSNSGLQDDNYNSKPSYDNFFATFALSLRGCPRENHAKPCRRCYRLDHRVGLYSVSKYTWVYYFQI